MNQQLIEAFHAYETFNDVLDASGLKSKQFEQLIIQAMRKAYPMIEEKPKRVSAPPSPVVDNPSSMKGSDLKLSDEQQHFVQMALVGENIFLTAPGGYGKTFSIHTAADQLRKRYDTNPDQPSKVAVCASTGKAASLINGKTVHSYLGIGLAKQSADELYERLITTRRLRPKYKELSMLKTLIIDEVSMINDTFLNKISLYLELIKKNDKPFGGVQMIFVGDLHQLPPVEGKYFINAISYRDLHPIVIQLTKCFRQDNPVFQQVLAEARVGKLSQESFEILMAQNSIDQDLFPGMKPMLICPTNREVDAINQRELNKLSTEKKVYCIQPISPNARKIEITAKMEGIPEQIELAIDAQIMITTNISMGGGYTIANGTQGKVVSMFDTHINAQLVGWGSEVKIGFQKLLDPDCIDEDSNPVYLFEYLPVRLGWGSSVHRSQGMTCSMLEVDLSRIFAAGQAYVAISRVRSLEGLKITGLKKNAFMADPKIIEFYAKH